MTASTVSPALTPDTCARLGALGAATIYEAQGQRGSIDPAIKPLDSSSVLVGRALTVDVGPGDNLMLHAALAHAQPGDVLVADAHGYLGAGAWGDVLATAAKHRGIAGLVIDGAVRDAAELSDMKFPVFARGLCIRGTTKTYRGSIGEPVSIAGTVVHRGDIIVGDRDGLVVVPADELDESLRLAQLREDKETDYRRRIAEGASTVELLGLGETLRAYGLD